MRAIRVPGAPSVVANQDAGSSWQSQFAGPSCGSTPEFEQAVQAVIKQAETEGGIQAILNKITEACASENRNMLVGALVVIEQALLRMPVLISHPVATDVNCLLCAHAKQHRVHMMQVAAHETNFIVQRDISGKSALEAEEHLKRARTQMEEQRVASTAELESVDAEIERLRQRVSELEVERSKREDQLELEHKTAAKHIERLEALLERSTGEENAFKQAAVQTREQLKGMTTRAQLLAQAVSAVQQTTSGLERAWRVLWS
jgi:DNA repair exonuclease SbcCD ATPase subunit